MAKLNVEVLDMTNGEITKVAYEGAEYTLLGTDITAKSGDLLQSNGDTESTSVLANGIGTSTWSFVELVAPVESLIN